MIGRVEFDKDAEYSVQVIDWEELVFIPANKGYFIEAFASADALLDWQLISILKQIYDERKCQDLINELGCCSKEFVLGSNIAKILLSKTVIVQSLYEGIIEFKKARNLVTHNIQGEYSLVIGNPDFYDVAAGDVSLKYKTQKELDSFVKGESNYWLNEVKRIFSDLQSISSGLNEPKVNSLFSASFYKAYPRGKQHKKFFPRKFKKSKTKKTHKI